MYCGIALCIYSTIIFGAIAGDRGEKKKEVDVQSSKKKKEVNHNEKKGKVKSTDKKGEKVLKGKKGIVNFSSCLWYTYVLLRKKKQRKYFGYLRRCIN